MTRSKPSKEELLIDNAILRFKDVVRDLIREELSPISVRVTSLEEGHNAHNARLSSIEEVLQPFITWRKASWKAVVYGVLGIGAVAAVTIYLKGAAK